MKKFVLLLLTLMVGLVTQAMVTTPIKFAGVTQTNGSNTMCAWFVESTWGSDQLSQLPGSSYEFVNYEIRANNSPATISLKGTLNFQEGTSAADVITSDRFIVLIESSSLWFYGATVKTSSDVTVTDVTVTVSSDKHSLIVGIPEGNSFGYISVNYVPNEPFSSSNTVISGVDDEYLYSGTPIEPEPTVTYKGTVLTKGTDYTVSYAGSNSFGSATVIVTGTGNYTGIIRKFYTLRDVDLRDFHSLGNNTYEIATTTDLDYLARYVNGDYSGNDCAGLTFLQTANISYSYTLEWNIHGENNYTPVGAYSKPFKGTYDGQNHTISGIRIFKKGYSTSDESKGLFGYVGGGGTVKNVILANACIAGYTHTGGIVGYNGGAIEDCRVESKVFVQSINGTNSVGGIAGICAFGGSISRCTFKGNVQFTSFPSSDIGGIVGTLSNNCTVNNCLVINASVSGDVNYTGAIAGNKTGTLTANYYHKCKVATHAHPILYVNVGVGLEGGHEDQDGARSVHALTLPDNVTATGESVDIDSATYYAAATTVTLNYGDELPAGYAPVYSVNGTAIEGNTFEMPAEDVTVTVTVTLVVGLPIDSINFPDANFRNYLLSQSFGRDHVLTDDEIAAITSIYVVDKGIADLTGIEHFTALTGLYCSINQLDTLDVSHNTALTALVCYGNRLTSLDLSHNTALTFLSCERNQLTALDVSHNTDLTMLNCSDNQINGRNMEALVASLPVVDGDNGHFYVINLDSGTEQNVITPSQVSTAKGKNWAVWGFIDGWWDEYDGSEPSYAISLPSSFEHGSVTCDKETAAEGETVTLTVTPDNGYELETLTVTIASGDEPSGAPKRLRGGSVELTPGDEPNTYTFEMPDAPVTVSATFVESTVTGIVDLDAAKPKTRQRYNLMGLPVGKDYKGIVIEDGRKLIVR